MSRPFDFAEYQKDELRFAGVSLKSVAEKFGTPAYVYSADALTAPLRELRDGLKGIDSKICFAVKSNSNLAVLKLLIDNGAGLDIVSGGELYRATRAGASPEKIVFSGVGKSAKEMEEALSIGRSGIFAFNVESLPELKQLNAVASRLKRRASVSLRFNPDVDAKTHPYISTGLKKNKFGLERREVLSAIKSRRDFPWLDFRGISTHIGSQLLSLAPLSEAFALVAELIDELNVSLDQPISCVDIGGGLGVAYKNERTPEIAKYCQNVKKIFGPASPLARKYGPLTVVLEPGRLLSANAGVLLTRVVLRKSRDRKDFIVVDAGMNDLIRPALYESHHEIAPVRKPTRSARKADVVGPVCETGDFFALDRKLDASIDAGDLLALLSAGAYGFTMASNYNSRGRPAEVLIQNGKARLIRERETYSDLTRGELL